MTIEKRSDNPGFDVHFDPSECELFVKLASDAATASAGKDVPAHSSADAQSYFSLSLEMGKKMQALWQAQGPGRAS